ncbi:hypothetical protein BFU36_00945 [Sulfolobus sp. A20]|uniref:hypothetical protein n=1 Tax=Sulfolobaceae TaxID=118883 RepID=UPI0008461A0A|nr:MULTISPECIES: hypothetical protein [unclassified Sulfolobus]TRM75450.1 hypothetical protein DJ523_02795 [Sulfolobus sp. E5]TRM77046.1 hypothetical protein DJ532_06145 [Sulfolobus sp. A20-N-F8]TRM79403.1 hypothetical protein DJ528_01185 [Sulfolobus sp. B5]TRM80592.1 hypothetical protein DJ524_07100 [Sulfolobus sp. D5]TRM83743.1 hypothetical protein DJ531_03885 [Sulfolobus sp. A20-N-F6]TRM84241.1 hypothetical protein DJ522_05175 [Sulfolobus sp. F3]TRM88455.1 hypothetical protein DJ529_05300
MWIDIRVRMSLNDYLKKKGFSLTKHNEMEKVVMDDYEFYIANGNTVLLPIPLPTGKESLDDLVSMGIKYARASRIAQGLGSPLEYELKGSIVYVIKKYGNRQDLESGIIKSLEGIESLRYFL